MPSSSLCWLALALWPPAVAVRPGRGDVLGHVPSVLASRRASPLFSQLGDMEWRVENQDFNLTAGIGSRLRITVAGWSTTAATITISAGDEVSLLWEVEPDRRVARSSGASSEAERWGGWPFGEKTGPAVLELTLTQASWVVRIDGQWTPWFDYRHPKLLPAEFKVSRVQVGGGLRLDGDGVTVKEQSCDTTCHSAECGGKNPGGWCRSTVTPCLWRDEASRDCGLLAPPPSRATCCTGLPVTLTPQTLTHGSVVEVVPDQGGYLRRTCKAAQLNDAACKTLTDARGKLTIMEAEVSPGRAKAFNVKTGATTWFPAWAIVPSSPVEQVLDFAAGLAGMHVEPEAGEVRLVDDQQQAYKLRVRVGWYCTKIELDGTTHPFSASRLESVVQSGKPYKLGFSDARPVGKAEMCHSRDDWVDSRGKNCIWYDAKEWCTFTGLATEAWKKGGCGWGSITCKYEEFAAGNLSALDACCSCGGGVLSATGPPSMPEPATSPTSAPPRPRPEPSPAAPPPPMAAPSPGQAPPAATPQQPQPGKPVACSGCFPERDGRREMRGVVTKYVLKNMNYDQLKANEQLYTEVKARILAIFTKVFADAGLSGMDKGTHIVLSSGSVIVEVICWELQNGGLPAIFAALHQKKNDLSVMLSSELSAHVAGMHEVVSGNLEVTLAMPAQEVDLKNEASSNDEPQKRTYTSSIDEAYLWYLPWAIGAVVAILCLWSAWAIGATVGSQQAAAAPKVVAAPPAGMAPSGAPPRDPSSAGEPPQEVLPGGPPEAQSGSTEAAGSTPGSRYKARPRRSDRSPSPSQHGDGGGGEPREGRSDRERRSERARGQGQEEDQSPSRRSERSQSRQRADSTESSRMPKGSSSEFHTAASLRIPSPAHGR